MELDLTQRQDLAHRLLHWVETHRKHLIILLVCGVGFFGILAGLTAYFRSHESKAQEALYAAQNKKETLALMMQNFPRSQASVFALMQMAQNNVEEKNFDSCITQYEQLYQKATHQTLFRVLSLHGMASCHQSKGDFSKAAELFERAAKEPGHILPALSRFEAARSLELAKDPKSLAHYEELLQEKELPSDLKEQIEEKILWFRIQ